MKKRILITEDKNGMCNVSTTGKFKDGELADMLCAAYARAIVDAMSEHNLTSDKVAEIAVYAIRKNIEQMRKREDK